MMEHIGNLFNTASQIFITVSSDIDLILGNNSAKDKVKKSDKNKVYLAYARIICSVVMLAKVIEIKNVVWKILENGDVERIAKAIMKLVIALDIFRISHKITKLINSEDETGVTGLDEIKYTDDETNAETLTEEAILRPLWVHFRKIWLRRTIDFFSNP